MTQLQDMDVDFMPEDCQFALRALENEAYSAVISAVRARGPLNQYVRLVLEHLRLILNVSFERHKSEVRRALADPVLVKVARGLHPQTDLTFEWVEEAKRVFANGNYASSALLDSPSFYRFNFLRSSKNDVLLQLADSLAYLAVQHNRSKSVENGDVNFFEALKKPKTRESGENSIKRVDFAPPFTKVEKMPPASQPPVNSAGAQREKQPVVGSRKKVAQKHGNASSSTAASASQASKSIAVGGARKGAGRPRKVTSELPATKQRFGQLIAARSASAMRRQVTSSLKRGRGGSKFTRVPALSASATHSLAKTGSSVPQGQASNVRPMFAPFYPFFQHMISSAPTSPRRPSQLVTAPSRPFVGPTNQSIVGQKVPPERHLQTMSPLIRRGGAPWPPSDLRPSCSSGKVPVAPLSVMLPMSRAASRGSGGGSRYCSGPSSPTRPSLIGEAPGVYADDYNANSVESMDQARIVKSSPEIPMQPHHFFSSLSATYYAQNAPSPMKMRRSSPVIAAGNQSATASLAGSGPGVTGISVKSNSRSGAPSSGAQGGAKAAGGVAPGTSLVPMNCLDSAPGQKVIVLPSSIIRRAQQQHSGTTTDQDTDPVTSKASQSQQPTKQQSVIIVRRAASSPFVSSVASTATTPTPTSVAVAPIEPQDEGK